MRLLLAIDGSEASELAMRSVADRPWPSGSTLRVLVVARSVYPEYGGGPFFPETVERLTRRALDEATAVATRTAESLAATELTVDTSVRQGDPRLEIVAEAQAWPADLLLVGSHGRTGVQRWLIGSVAEYVVRHAPCSVEVVRRRSVHT
jgi:nucleotide-binding universal stress UspA family protein